MARTVAKTQAEYEANRRFALALILVLAGVGGVLLIAAAVIFASAADADESQMVFSGVIPILGTWVGTVLAFYFARDNLKAATDSAVALAKSETAAETDVSAVMIGLAEIVAEDVQDDAAARALSVKALKKKMLDATPPRGRLPIRDAKGAVLYVLHESTAEKFITSPTRPPGDSPTFGELLDLPEFRGPVEAIGLVTPKATLADARAAMAAIAGCNDVFVTANGKREESVVGWLTNTLLAEHT